MRRRVVDRAGNRCEYCLLDQEFAASTHQVDQVIAEKHGGETTLDNLALSCTVCNRRKGSDVSSIDPETGDVVLVERAELIRAGRYRLPRS
ncbi:MAG: HNH endonuclease signature motif containing protein [Planctomycetota bacterium]|nr:HNH endonuclease signature motif containing protein [Planctomycetota bacterium]